MAKDKKEKVKIAPEEVEEVNIAAESEDEQEDDENDGFGRKIMLTDEWALTSDSNCFALKKRMVVTKKDTGDKVEKWKIEGFYGKVHQVIAAMAEKGIIDARGNMTIIKKHIEKVDVCLSRLPDILICCKEYITIPPKVVALPVPKKKVIKEVEPAVEEVKLKKTKKKPKGWEK